jgi:glycosyltransferase involved in cell wall biosynthesis
VRVFYIWFYARPFPDYPSLATALRKQGHESWWAGYDEAGNVAWNDGEGKVAEVRGPRLLPQGDKFAGRLAAGRWRWQWFGQSLAFLGLMLRLRRFLCGQRPDVVHVCPNNARLVWLLPLFMPRRIRFVIDYRQIAQREGRGFSGKIRSAWSNGMRVVSCRHSFNHATFLHEAGARKVLGPSWARWASVVPLGVDPRFLHEPVGVTNNVRADKDGKVRFVYLGSLARVRQLEGILHAARKMMGVTANFQLDFIGPDVAEGYYYRLAEQLGLNEMVAFRPAVPYSNVPAVLGGYDVALAITPAEPPDWQYQPTIKIVEYRAAGIPIIATESMPNREIVQQEVNGVLVTYSVDEMAAAMLRFVCDPGFLRRCRASAQIMRQGLTWEQIAELYVQQVYQKALG